jgi:hypothetical protein
MIDNNTNVSQRVSNDVLPNYSVAFVDERASQSGASSKCVAIDNQSIYKFMLLGFVTNGQCKMYARRQHSCLHQNTVRISNFDVGISKVMVVLLATRIITGLQLVLPAVAWFLFHHHKIEGNIMAGTRRR